MKTETWDKLGMFDMNKLEMLNGNDSTLPFPLLRVHNLCKYFPLYSKGFRRKQIGTIKAADNINFNLMPGETIGLVGESGSGKTTTGRAILRAIAPTSGEVLLDCHNSLIDIAKVPDKHLKKLRTRMQMIFQDPFSSLNPRMTVRDIVAEPLVIHKMAKGNELEDRIDQMLKKVGLTTEHRMRYPHAFSGGQRQRIGIARALIMEPLLVVADEAVSALDVSVQAQVINLMEDLQKDLGLTYIFIAHDLSVVKHICDKVAVMYAGKIVELATTEQLFEDPQHPYTKALLRSVPNPNPDIKMEFGLEGEVADLAKLPPGCPFHPRCRECTADCRITVPELTKLNDQRNVSCLLFREK